MKNLYCIWSFNQYTQIFSINDFRETKENHETKWNLYWIFSIKYNATNYLMSLIPMDKKTVLTIVEDVAPVMMFFNWVVKPSANFQPLNTKWKKGSRCATAHVKNVLLGRVSGSKLASFDSSSRTRWYTCFLQFSRVIGAVIESLKSTEAVCFRGIFNALTKPIQKTKERQNKMMSKKFNFSSTWQSKW